MTTFYELNLREIALEFLERAKQTQAKGEPVPGILEGEIEPLLDNTWGDTAKALVNNWLGLVYKVTNLDRNMQFMEEVDPSDPLDMNL